MINNQSWEITKSRNPNISRFCKLGHVSLRGVTYEQLKSIEENEGKLLMQEKFLVGFDEDGNEVWEPYGLVGELQCKSDLGLLGIFIQDDFHLLPRHFMSEVQLEEFCHRVLKENHSELLI